MWVAVQLFVSRGEEEHARAHAREAATGHQHTIAAGRRRLREQLASVEAWSDVAHNFRGDWRMLYKEITAGFLIAGFVGLLPRSIFEAAFVQDAPSALRTVENVLVGPLIAILSFVCSVGNIPLAAILWAGGISFAGVIAFIYADLITLPIILIYRKYYGNRFALKLTLLMLATMVIAALVVDLAFSALGLVPDTRPSIESITERGIELNYTAVLNIVFTLVGAALVWLTVLRGYTDPVCGMRVDRYQTPHHTRWQEQTVYFCSAGCKERFEATPERYTDKLGAARHADLASRHMRA
jgi:YHS domain-containing protein